MKPFLANIVVDYFVQGGPIMWPILLALVAWPSRSSFSGRCGGGVWAGEWIPAPLHASFDAIAAGEFKQALSITVDSTDPFLRTVHEGLLQAHTSLLEARCSFGHRMEPNAASGCNGSWGR